ncbi:6436_t:CDS:10 [Cetraspora pellucida]|uniref:DNA topoisomerase n=1 Tax=Cetraspora pellucida TaxID=1433469 RepID=A0A9N9DN44_9GLOM|nr:6436_t:CDS:10 [Cetraspora pellucida]
MSCTALMIAEKPSLAESISKLLAPNGRLIDDKNISSLDFTKEFNDWNIDPLELFTARTIKLEASKSGGICQHLRQESKGVDYVILWLDCDREGENICFEVIKNVREGMKRLPDGRPKDSRILRAKFSAITATDIRRAMNNLTFPNENESLAVDARQEFDLKVGCAFTRFQTKFFNQKYGNLDSSVISYGPCQTPTLSFCVSRHDQIKSFSPEPFWTLSVSVAKQGANGEQCGSEIHLSWEKARVFDKHVATTIQSMVRKCKEAKVISISSEKKTKGRPHALNTVELLKFGSSNLGIGPHETMLIAERLYTQGYISYPRTETTTYPKNFDIKSVLKDQSRHDLWGLYAKELLEKGFEWPTGGSDAGDHPPITPMRVVNEGDLSGDSWRIYNYVTRHFIGSISPNLKYQKTNAIIKIGDESFECSGIRVLQPGFSSIMHWRSMSDQILQELHQDEILKITNVKLVEGLTSPPDYLTESEVISLMEKHGIGTDASIPAHINNICQRNYVTVQTSARRLVPTNLEKIDPELSLPTMRSEVEKQLNYIALGRARQAEVLEHCLNLFAAKFKYFRDNVAQMDELFEATFSPLASTGKILTKCGNCPCVCIVQPPLDGFGLVSFSTGSKDIGYPLCPNCYNNPPFENVKKGMGCNRCPHPTCEHSLTNNEVCSCQVNSCTGQMVLDATSAPKWKLSCNVCNFVSVFTDLVKGVSISKDEYCENEECNSCVLKIEFRENQNKKPLKGCILCEDEIAELLENK